MDFLVGEEDTGKKWFLKKKDSGVEIQGEIMTEKTPLDSESFQLLIWFCLSTTFGQLGSLDHYEARYYGGKFTIYTSYEFL